MLNPHVVRLFRLALVGVVLVILYLTTTAAEYELAQGLNDKLSHAVAFLVLSLLADFSYPHTRFSWFKICPLFGYGVLIECIQYFLPYRTFSLLDIAADTLGIVFYGLSVPLLVHVPVLRGRWRDRQRDQA